MDQPAAARPLQLKTCCKDMAVPAVAFSLSKLLGCFMMVQLGKKISSPNHLALVIEK